MGFDIERFVDSVNEGLLCSICRDVLEDPLQAPCEHAFCSSCIHAWLTHYNNCPEDRQALWPSDLKPIFRYMKNDLDALKLRCDNEPRGCKDAIPLASLKGHLKDECGFVEVSCTNAGCKEKLNRRDLDGHLVICEYQAIDCSKGCGLKVSLSAAAEHNCISELRKALEKQQTDSEAKLQDLKQDMESRLDSHRVHMVYKEATLQNQIEDLKSQVAELLRDTKTLKARETAREVQRREGSTAHDSERKEILEWLRGLKYQDEIAERFCSSCNKRYLYVRKETLQTCSDQIPRVNPSSSASSEEDAILGHIRACRSTKTRSWCPSPVTGHALSTPTLPRSQGEQFSFNRAMVESWRRTPEVSTPPCTGDCQSALKCVRPS